MQTNNWETIWRLVHAEHLGKWNCLHVLSAEAIRVLLKKLFEATAQPEPRILEILLLLNFGQFSDAELTGMGSKINEDVQAHVLSFINTLRSNEHIKSNPELAALYNNVAILLSSCFLPAEF